jgi:PhoH-like ATPase
MPLPKMPSKPASMLSPEDYPKADRNKPVKPNITLVETSAPVVASQEVAVAVADVSDTKVTAPRARITGKTAAVAEKPKAAPKSAEVRPKSPTSRVADKLGKSKLFVLDTNVLMHDPTSLFRFEEHDIYLPMVTLEELDNHKKGMSEVARNARQISRSLDALVSDVAED